MSERKRASRHKRPKNPSAHRMTSRDEKIIEAVYNHRVLTRELVERLFFHERSSSNKSSAQRRLRLLWENGYLQRRFPASIGGIQTSHILYLLDKRGSEYLLKRMGYDEVRWRPKDNSIGYEHLEHLIDINRLRVLVAKASEEYGYPLLFWIDDTTLKKSYDRVSIQVAVRRDGSRVYEDAPVIPDGHFGLDVGSGKQFFFVEVDRGTMASKRFKRKIQAYMAYARSGLIQERFKTKKFRVLVITLSDRRLENLKRATEDVGGKNRFWFANLNRLTINNIFTQPLWSVADRQKPAILLPLKG